jgi:hypothetical protein
MDWIALDQAASKLDLTVAVYLARVDGTWQWHHDAYAAVIAFFSVRMQRSWSRNKLKFGREFWDATNGWDAKDRTPTAALWPSVGFCGTLDCNSILPRMGQETITRIREQLSPQDRPPTRLDHIMTTAVDDGQRPAIAIDEGTQDQPSISVERAAARGLSHVADSNSVPTTVAVPLHHVAMDSSTPWDQIVSYFKILSENLSSESTHRIPLLHVASQSFHAPCHHEPRHTFPCAACLRLRLRESQDGAV